MNKIFKEEIKKILLLMVMASNLSANYFNKHEMDCDNNLSDGCRERAYLALEVNKNYDEAEKYFLKACELNDAKSCSLLGYMYRSKNAKKRDEKKYFQFFDKACQIGDANSCTIIGSLYYSKNSSNSTKKNMIKVKIEDLIQATKYYKKACELGNQRGCERLATNYLLGYGIKKDRKKAIKLFKKNCQLNYNGCLLYVGVTRKNQRYRDLNISELKRLSKGCELNSSNSCNNLGFLSLEVYQDYNKAETYFRKACQLKNQESCKMLGFIYKNKHTGKQDFKKSFKYFNRACKLGNGYACSYLALMYLRGEGIEKDTVKSTLAYEKACHLGNDRGCTFLGDRYRLGQGTKMDKVKVIELYKQSCTNNEHYGCVKYIGFSAQK